MARHSLWRAAGAAALALRLLAGPAAADGMPADLTPFGAIRAGDENRFIPAWTGGLAEPVKDYQPGRAHPDPFFEDVRWFTVKAADLERYKVRLSSGLQELLRRYPKFEIPLYPGRRTAAAPQAVYDATAANLGSAKLIENGLGVSGAKVGIPFPVPKDGAEAMWNHLLRWRGGTVVRSDGVAIPDAYGQVTLSLYREEVLPAYGQGIEGPLTLYYRRTGLEPESVRGALLVQETLNPLVRPRAVWYRPPGDRRVLRAPDFADDTPDPASGGIRTADMLDMFNGTMDRFAYRLIGRRSMYVPYNAYRLDAAGLSPAEFLWSSHPNPSFLRYELHRVWIVEASLKSGYKHAFPERIYYLDEDSWQIVMADHFGPDGTLQRYAEAHGATYSQIPVFAPAVEITYDFPGNRYVVNGVDNLQSPPVYGRPLKPEAFGPESLQPPGRWQR